MKEANTIESRPRAGHAQAKTLRYALVTPARNEAAFIEETIKSVIAQTILPAKWVIVSDGSTDGTDEIVAKYASVHDWIELVRTPERKERDFGGKVRAFNAGYIRLEGVEYDVVGNLDADGSFDVDYVEYLLNEFAQNPRLGVAGTNYWESAWEKSLKHDYRYANSEDVSGLCQLFRRECFEAIGGYTPSRRGGVDLMASIRGRMHGWETRTFTGKFAVHHRQQGTAESHPFMVEFYNGRKDYLFGSHPIWEVLRAIYRLTRKPYIVGGCLLFAGYFSGMLRGMDKSFPKDVVKFRRGEQMRRLRTLMRRIFIR